MECNNVSLKTKAEPIKGKLVMDESNNRIILKKQLTLGEQAMITVGTAVDEPIDLLGTIVLSAVKAATNNRARVKTPFGEDLSRNINNATVEMWTASINDMRKVSVNGNELKIKMYMGKNYKLMFSSETKAKKWENVLTKLINGEKCFIW